ncbi:MAG: glycosyltransferase family 1 protein [Parasphingorhabdus sp.]|uniref:glycosyltransferase family 4 protein n=1 Tax=Parasphingorhabdus sp. TaxID=2709688 RepID=UPI0030016DCC
MLHPKKIAINGKFLSAEPTGVHRVAEELIRNAYAIIDADHHMSEQLQLELLVPSDGMENAERLGLPYRIVGPFTGIAWEQLTLPLHAGGRTLLSLCNVGPVLSRNAVTMFHDAQVHIAPDSYSPMFRLWYHFHQPICGKRHRRILTVSDYSREQLDQYKVANRDKTKVILNGVDHVLETAADDEILSELELERNGFAVALANIQPHKNIGLLLKVFSRPELQNLKLVLFGSATRDMFQSAGHLVPSNVIFAGRVSDGELRSLYANALCLAFPSRTEGFGLPPLEAMTTGCPAIVAPEGALPQVCGDGAIYAGADDLDAWVNAISLMSSDGSYLAKIRAAGLSQSAAFTWKRAASQMVEYLLAL